MLFDAGLVNGPATRKGAGEKVPVYTSVHFLCIDGMCSESRERRFLKNR
jgi:hypothetical protein